MSKPDQNAPLSSATNKGPVDQPRRLHRRNLSGSSALDEATIAHVVDSFYAKARDDDLLGPIFERAVAANAWAEHLATVSDFWSAMLLGTGRYHGRPMPKHLAIPELGETHFLRWLALFEQTAKEICPPETASLFADRAGRVAEAWRLNIAMHRGESLLDIKPLRAPSP